MTVMTKRTLLATSAAVTATAVVGGLGTDPLSAGTATWTNHGGSPPPGSSAGLDDALRAHRGRHGPRAGPAGDPAERQSLQRALGANLALNAGWNWLFFRARRPDLALGEVLLLEASTLDLARRAGRSDPLGGQLLWPYAAWVAFATALNAAIARRNRARSAR